LQVPQLGLRLSIGVDLLLVWWAEAHPTTSLQNGALPVLNRGAWGMLGPAAAWPQVSRSGGGRRLGGLAGVFGG